MYYTRFIVCLLLLIPLIGSAKSKKTEKAILLSSEMVIHSPGNLSEIHPGETLRVKADIPVNFEFKECLFKLVKGGAEENIDLLLKAFHYPIVSNADGLLLPVFSDKKSMSIDFKMKVKETAIVGDYKYSLILRDAEGNEKVKAGYFMIVKF